MIRRYSTVVGIDPGINGAVAVLYRGELVAVHDMPTASFALGKGNRRRVDARELHNIIDEVDPDVVVIEDVGHVGNGGAFSFGHAVGVAWGAAAGHKMWLVKPKVWQASAGIVKADKAVSRAKAIELWPEWSADFRLLKHADRAEAALIARWAWLGGHA